MCEPLTFTTIGREWSPSALAIEDLSMAGGTAPSAAIASSRLVQIAILTKLQSILTFEVIQHHQCLLKRWLLQLTDAQWGCIQLRRLQGYSVLPQLIRITGVGSRPRQYTELLSMSRCTAILCRQSFVLARKYLANQLSVLREVGVCSLI